jgi:hypothetical protein
LNPAINRSVDGYDAKCHEELFRYSGGPSARSDRADEQILCDLAVGLPPHQKPS